MVQQAADIKKIKVDGETLTVESVWAAAYGTPKFELPKIVRTRMEQSRAYIMKAVRSGDVIYGVNTGFGALSSVRINDSQIAALQCNLIRSHAVGVGEPFTVPEVRAIMLLRANALVRGHSGVRPAVVEKVLEFLEKGLAPVVPAQGSVGASGDLAPLAHVALALIGEGEVFFEGARVDTARAMKKSGVKPLVLEAKEGLSLINGCQVMTAIGLLNAYEARRLNMLSDVAGAMTLEGIKGSRSAFDPLISSVRRHPGEAKTARNLLKILGSSQIGKSHESCERVQDAYSLRCMPQVHGAVKDTLQNTIRTLEIEANSSTDNPLVFDREDKILSCGNFHGEPVAFALDFLGIAVSAMASISECRIEKMINPSMSSGLPAFLARDGGLNSGMMIVEVAAASLVSENKILSHPASVDSIPTSADKEDHVSMGTIAARKLGQIVKNAENVCAMELFCAYQALDLLKPLKPAAGVAAAYGHLKKSVPEVKGDRAFYKDIDQIRALIRDGSLLSAVVGSTGELEW